MLAAARAIQTQPDEVQAAVTLAVTSPTDAAMAVIKPARKLIGGLISGGTVEGGAGATRTLPFHRRPLRAVRAVPNAAADVPVLEEVPQALEEPDVDV